MKGYQPRAYRDQVSRPDLVAFAVSVQETDLLVQSRKPLADFTREQVLRCRTILENYIRRFPEFASTLAPWSDRTPAPAIIRDMVRAGQKAGVGPMAAVAGAIAEHVGLALLSETEEVIVENGGDIFLNVEGPLTVGICAGRSVLSARLGLRIFPGAKPLGVCTSSGTVGHSLSLGRADAVSVLSRSCCLADAAATAIANRVQSARDITGAIAFGRQIEGITGIAVVCGKTFGAWGEVEVVPLNGKRG